MSGLFKNKNVLITGASSGIGLATAEEFVEEGAFVTLIDYSEDIKKIANKLKCKYLKIDLSMNNSYQRVSLFVKMLKMTQQYHVHRGSILQIKAGVILLLYPRA